MTPPKELRKRLKLNYDKNAGLKTKMNTEQRTSSDNVRSACTTSHATSEKTVRQKETGSTYLESSPANNRTTLRTDQTGRKAHLSRSISAASGVQMSDVFQGTAKNNFQNHDPLLVTSFVGCQSLQGNSCFTRNNFKLDKNHHQSLRNNRKRVKFLQSPEINFVRNMIDVNMSEGKAMDGCHLCDLLEQENLWLNFKIAKCEKALNDLRLYIKESKLIEKKSYEVQEQNKKLLHRIKSMERDFKKATICCANLVTEQANLKRELSTKMHTLQQTREELRNVKEKGREVATEKDTYKHNVKKHIQDLEASIIAQRSHFKKLLFDLKEELFRICSPYIDVN